MKKIEHQEENKADKKPVVDETDGQAEETGSKQRFSLLPVFLFLISIVVVAGISYQGWVLFMQNKQQTQLLIDQLQSELAKRPTQSQVNSGISSIRQSVNKTDSRLSNLEQGQQALMDSTEKLYELYGRDENSWKLAEVEYLMSIAQHKLVLENDFEGAAKTLSAASKRIADLADPGLLQVRVLINEEIAQLKTRQRADLVGMTLLVSRLTRQITSLKPGYQKKTEAVAASSSSEETIVADSGLTLKQQFMRFVDSLYEIKSAKVDSDKSVSTAIIDVTSKLEDNLKLTRWSVLERDAFQYNKLMTQNVSLFKEYYDLEKADNNDFYNSLLSLQKSKLNPEVPDITGSLRLLKKIIKKRESEPKQETQQGADNG